MNMKNLIWINDKYSANRYVTLLENFWYSFHFLFKIQYFLIFLKKKNHLKDQICSVSIAAWPMLSGFVVEGWKSDFYDN